MKIVISTKIIDFKGFKLGLDLYYLISVAGFEPMTYTCLDK